MLLSLLDNNKGEGMCIHLLANGLDDDDVGKVYRVVQEGGARLEVYAVDSSLLESLPRGQYGYITPTTYARLFLADILPVHVGRVIYLDCDLLVLDSLRSLWEYPLDEGHDVAAVEDSCSANPSYYERLHLSAGHRYFNAGVLLVDLVAWRTRGFVGQAMDLLSNGGLRLDYADQDVLNVLCEGRTKYLPFRYNLQEAMLRQYVPEISECSRKEIVASLDSPVIIHFTYILKPWCYTSFHPYKPHFYYYFDQTEWCGERPSPSWKERVRRWMWGCAAFFHLVNRYHPLPERMLPKYYPLQSSGNAQQRCR